MAEHPIQDLMKTAMDSIKGMVDVNIVVGNAVESPDGTVIIPVSRVSFGFAAGGGDYNSPGKENTSPIGSNFHFGGGSGAGVSVKPIGFLVCAKGGDVRFLSVDTKNPTDRIVDLIPKVLDKIGEFMDKKCVKENGGALADIEVKMEIDASDEDSEKDKNKDKGI